MFTIIYFYAHVQGSSTWKKERKEKREKKGRKEKNMKKDKGKEKTE